MKTLVVSIKRILQSPVLFFLIIIQTAIIIIAMNAIYNIYYFTHNSINSMNHNGIRMIYVSVIGRMPQINDLSYIEEMDELFLDYGNYLGVSYIANGYTFTGDNGTLRMQRKYISGEEITQGDMDACKYEDVALTYYYNTITLQAISYPLKNGKWKLDELVDGYIPCVIGGSAAKSYRVGDIVDFYTQNNTYDDIIPVSYIITGILAEPLYAFSANAGATSVSDAFRISKVFNNMNQEHLVLYTNSDLTSAMELENFFVRNNYFVFFDKHTTTSELIDYENLIGAGYATIDEDMIAMEKFEITEMMDIILPFFIIIFVVSLISAFSMSIIMFLKNLNTYSIYFILGCTRIQVMMISLIYSLCYIITSCLLSFLVMKVIGFIDFGFYGHFIIMNNALYLPIILLFFMVAILSFIFPFIKLKRVSIKELFIKTLK